MLSPTNWHVAVLGSEGSPEFDSGWSSHTGPFYVIHFDMVSYVLLLLCRRTSSAGWKCANILAIKAKIGNIVWTYHSALKLSQCRHCVKAEWTVRDNWTWRPWPIRGGMNWPNPLVTPETCPCIPRNRNTTSSSTGELPVGLFDAPIHLCLVICLKFNFFFQLIWPFLGHF